MIRKFEIVQDIKGKKHRWGILNYNTKENSYTIDIDDPPEKLKHAMPGVLDSLYAKGEKHIGEEFAMMWVRMRVVPPGRQNIAEILRNLGMEYYNEFEILLANGGRNVMDDTYILEITDSEEN